MMTLDIIKPNKLNFELYVEASLDSTSNTQ